MMMPYDPHHPQNAVGVPSTDITGSPYLDNVGAYAH
jgi:hypothetical protein